MPPLVCTCSSHFPSHVSHHFCFGNLQLSLKGSRTRQGQKQSLFPHYYAHSQRYRTNREFNSTRNAVLRLSWQSITVKFHCLNIIGLRSQRSLNLIFSTHVSAFLRRNTEYQISARMVETPQLGFESKHVALVNPYSTRGMWFNFNGSLEERTYRLILFIHIA